MTKNCGKIQTIVEGSIEGYDWEWTTRDGDGSFVVGDTGN